MPDPWVTLREFTQARIALGHAGHALPTEALLDFQLAHARARDAIHHAWDVDAIACRIDTRGLCPVILSTQVADRTQYLKRPDLGRRLSPESMVRLQHARLPDPPPLALILSNGLSSVAMERHGFELMCAIVSALEYCALSPQQVFLVPNARVAVSDPIGAALGVRLAVIVVGERPGLSAADSLGIYLTVNPRPGNTDADRNCISNIRPPEGLAYAAAAETLSRLAQRALQLGYSGVALKDDTPDNRLITPS